MKMPKVRAYTQSICLTRRVEDVDGTLSKGDVLRQAMRVATDMSLPEGFELSSVDAWRVRVNKDGDEDRAYDE